MPPVTELKSPPDSRITGADSPVMALSSTDAAPSITSPSTGMTPCASISTTSPLRRSSALTLTESRPPRAQSLSFLASAVWRMPRSDSACARLRPSASASAKLANSTVNSSQIVIEKINPAGASPCPPSACKYRAPVTIVPRYTTNITGFRHWIRGSSLRSASSAAGPVSLRSRSESCWRAMDAFYRAPMSMKCSTSGPSASAGT